jgi:predicted ATPase/DNA-binding SARP family transcriptional activator
MPHNTPYQSSSALKILLFGPMEVYVHDKKCSLAGDQRWLLALLVLRAGRDVAREWLAETLWPDSPSIAAARKNLREVLSRLRHHLGATADCLSGFDSHSTLRFDMRDDIWVDVMAFAAVRERGKEADPAELEAAVQLYHGPLLEGCPREWIHSDREHWQQCYLAALEQLADLPLAQGRPAAAVGWLQRALAADPLRESTARALMQALADCGDDAAVKQVYRDLRLKLRQELNAEPGRETEALYRRLQARTERPTLVMTAPDAAPSRNLPVPLTDLIGREREIAELRGRLGRSRLITLTGAAGVGKTRLAIATADAVADRFPGGVWFVDLASLSNPDLVSHAVARSLGVSEEPERTIEQTLQNALMPRTLLLVLDNCEHLREAAALLTNRLLMASANLCVLATSRQSLGLYGEAVYRVSPLTLPPAHRPDETPDAEALLSYSAIGLFVERARQANQGFRLTRRNADAVAAICCRLDGIPLALELAAARVRSLRIEQIAARLQDHFVLLNHRGNSALPRHRTLAATLDWSYALLTDADRAVLRCLSVFAGGWTLEAAEAVCGPAVSMQALEGDLDPAAVTPERRHADAVQEILTDLVERSLVIYEDAEETGRFRLLKLTRDYACRHLIARSEEKEARRRHRDYYLELAEEVAALRHGPQQEMAFQWMNREHDNLRAALDWCREVEDEEAELRLVNRLWHYWSVRGHLTEGRAQLRAALSHRDTDLSGGERIARLRSMVLRGAGTLAFLQNDYTAARALSERGLAIDTALCEPGGKVATLNLLGMVAYRQRDYHAARSFYTQAQEINRELGNRHGESINLSNLGLVANEEGNYALARSLLDQAYIIDEQLGNLHGKALNRNNVGIMASEQGDYTEATRLCHEALTLLRDLGAETHLPDVLEALASVASRQGRMERAALLWGVTHELRRQMLTRMPEDEQEGYERDLAATRSALGERRFSAAWSTGQAMPLDRAIEFALSGDDGTV